jgi:hypothetical protein
MTQSGLRIDYATYEAALYACKVWHYSQAIPAGKTIKFGVWYDDRFLGVVIFAAGCNSGLGCQYGLTQFEVCELSRIALREHPDVFVSQVMVQALKKLKEYCPNMKLVISYADFEQGHYGKIYQATNWIFVEKIPPKRYWVINGKRTHSRTVTAHMKGIARREGRDGVPATIENVRKYLDPLAQRKEDVGKFKYLYPMNKTMRRKLLPLAKPYPSLD